MAGFTSSDQYLPGWNAFPPGSLGPASMSGAMPSALDLARGGPPGVARRARGPRLMWVVIVLLVLALAAVIGVEVWRMYKRAKGTGGPFAADIANVSDPAERARLGELQYLMQVSRNPDVTALLQAQITQSLATQPSGKASMPPIPAGMHPMSSPHSPVPSPHAGPHAPTSPAPAMLPLPTTSSGAPALSDMPPLPPGMANMPQPNDAIFANAAGQLVVGT